MLTRLNNPSYLFRLRRGWIIALMPYRAPQHALRVEVTEILTQAIRVRILEGSHEGEIHTFHRRTGTPYRGVRSPFFLWSLAAEVSRNPPHFTPQVRPITEQTAPTEE